MAAGSWIRFIVGLVLSLEAIRLSLSGNGSIVALGLSMIYIILVIVFALFRI